MRLRLRLLFCGCYVFSFLFGGVVVPPVLFENQNPGFEDVGFTV